MIVRLALVAVLALMAVLPGAASAQVPFPPRVADAVAECVTGNIPALLSAAASVEPITDGWRVLIPLAGQPPDLMAQTPPPTEDTLAWMDLYLFPNPNSVPPEVGGFDSSVIVTATGGAMVILHEGYFMLLLKSVGKQCVEYATGGTTVRG
jgi:hypothetical protein